MAWVPLHLSDVSITLQLGAGASYSNSVFSGDGNNEAGWGFVNDTLDARLFRIFVQSYAAAATPDPAQQFEWEDEDVVYHVVINSAPDLSAAWSPTTFEFTLGAGLQFNYSGASNDGSLGETFSMYVEVWEDDPPPPEQQYYVYEMEKGWSFDGNYIPHFLELNWLFQEDPFTYKSINKIRVHGLTKGVVNLQVSLSGMQGDPATDYIQDYMDPQFIDLPFTPIYVSSDFVSATNYTPYSDRGMALQMKFEGRNTARLLPEPAHVLQVLALQGTPSGNGARAQ